jgi:hypothetical protein
MIVRLIVIGFVLAVPALLQAQQVIDGQVVIGSESFLPTPEPPLDGTTHPYRNRRLNVTPPYAGKFEARIGGSSEPGDDKLRLDIGASADILRIGREWSFGREWSYRSRDIVIGADFFTWTRLRDAGGFKFPVEAVDYYFGLNSSVNNIAGLGIDTRLRVAHISAHLVDGDPSFSTADARYKTYSREFVDLMIAGNSHSIGGLFDSPYDRGAGGDHNWGEYYRISLRPYIGALSMFHSIPDTLGSFTPYGGFDIAWMPLQTDIISLRAGYELRVNTELETVIEHHVRTGVKVGELFGPGVLIEASYYYGRSPYGQHFDEIEETTSLGFAVEF